ncbi:hypothetical protein HaLaN_22956 [Haematococcus lacustris]|uniref:Uncharacterized protein n=1 Tax=Haematococcus lacustris TaxID=44745 RepID=A0A699ZV22_HAELA|nr:hypothetical protein HaLaN_22956 [Haematococcus lacustris]
MFLQGIAGSVATKAAGAADEEGFPGAASGEDKVELQADLTKLREEEKELQAMIRELENPDEARVLPPAPARLSATRTHPKPASGAAPAGSGAAPAASGAAAAGSGGAAAASGGAAAA